MTFYKMNKSSKVIPLETIVEVEENIITESKNKIKKFYKGWKRFAFKDDIINIAVGMIIATSFKSVINSMVKDILVPLLIGFGVGTHTENLFKVLVVGISGNNTYITLEEAKKDSAVTLNYGMFINVFMNLIFVSLFLYISLKLINKIKTSVIKEIKNIEHSLE